MPIFKARLRRRTGWTWGMATVRCITFTRSGRMADVTVIGAGVAGLCAAYTLSRAGFTPRLIDRNGAPGAHGCSWWAGG
ncbi:MAG: FAD-dependent oxidoreductase, partial [Paracoccaceae bacterium]